ncbi:MAG: PAS domain-containing protein, partial [Deltaproteobacteria bacterium]|nr:PAS domain-containing protein [Deltaproteobacteria bacterium]
RTARALDAWIAAVARLAPLELKAQAALAPLRAQFVAALAASQPARRAAGIVTASARRAVPGAIDRIADAFLAADAESGAIVDANPAACALLGLARPELLARELS